MAVVSTLALPFSDESEEREVPEHMMVEGFRWSIGLSK